ncbi:hypothetical protein Nepgr_027294 [Nepenthes gracilis]|uniref:Uncharacterized protein n=1 Tax=Nepenthes gracilis TaxID=150966 RepID=A0AAD3TA99_NEPGR|nr:hypothetical protein Nepgr_027294 [Nepenthes gracilis]
MPSSASWFKGSLLMSVWCHANVALFPGMNELRVRYAVSLASMEFFLFGGPVVLYFRRNAPIVDLPIYWYAFCPDWIFASMQHVAMNAEMTCCIFARYASLQQYVGMLMLSVALNRLC